MIRKRFSVVKLLHRRVAPRGMVMNIKLSLVAGLAAATLAGATNAYAQQDVRVVVDGERVRFHGQPPVEVDDRVLVPLRGVFESLGAEVDWNPESQTVTAHRGDTE